MNLRLARRLHVDLRVSVGKDGCIVFSCFWFLRREAKLFDPVDLPCLDSLSSGPSWLEFVS